VLKLRKEAHNVKNKPPEKMHGRWGLLVMLRLSVIISKAHKLVQMSITAFMR
jgi:hypothetical protein